jgi:hypothetical protein
MTKKARSLLNYAVDLIYKKVDFGKLRFKLSDCYKKCSNAKLTANLKDAIDFSTERNILKEKSGKNVKYLHIVTSYNTFNFTTLQIAYFFEDENKEAVYIAIRYDTSKRTVKKYFQYNKYDFCVATVYNSLEDMLKDRDQFNKSYITKDIDCKQIRLN